MSKGQTGMYAAILLLAIGLVAGTIMVVTQDQEKASVVDEVDGEFEQALISSDNIESPFATVNGFDSYTVDEDATAGTEDVLDQATAEWMVENGTDLGLKSRTAVLFFETDGAMDEVEVTLEDKLDSASYGNDAVSIEEIDFYDYEAAVDADDLSAGDRNVQFQEVDGTSAEATVGTLQEGEYAVVPQFEWNSGESTPSTEGTTDVLSTMQIEADTEGDVDEINSLDIQTTTK